jgi:mono/diheme cytochrome c family protein
MNKFLRWIGFFFAGLIVLLLCFYLIIYIATERRLNRIYTVEIEPFEISYDPVSIERGRHLADNVFLCGACHGLDYSGRIEVDDPVFGRLVFSNVSKIKEEYSYPELERLIRHGIRRDGKPAIMMPSFEYTHLSDPDMEGIIAYIKSLPVVDNDLPDSRFGPLARIFLGVGVFENFLSAEIIDHDAERPPIPEPGPTIEYGRYLASTCQSCHGPGYSGGKSPGSPPDIPVATNITPHGETGIGLWSKEDFYRAMRNGVRPSGENLDEFMPVSNFMSMTDMELDALWEYLRSLEPREFGNR